MTYDSRVNIYYLISKVQMVRERGNKNKIFVPPRFICFQFANEIWAKKSDNAQKIESCLRSVWMMGAGVCFSASFFCTNEVETMRKILWIAFQRWASTPANNVRGNWMCGALDIL